jgi:hypothetical protein
MRSRISCGVLLMLGFHGVAVGDPIHIVSDRTISGFVSFADPVGQTGASSFRHQTDALGALDVGDDASARTELAHMSVTASQQTTVDAAIGHLFGSGFISAEAGGSLDVDLNEVDSSMIVEFTLPHAMRFVLNGTLSASGDASSDIILQLLAPNQPVQCIICIDTPVNIARKGLLAPGSYGFIAQAQKSSPTSELGQASFDFDLALEQTTTPEPASFVLLGSGVIGLVSVRRRKSNTCAA